jgi:hypothetical protein
MGVVAGKAGSVDAITARLSAQIASSAINTLFPAHWAVSQDHSNTALGLSAAHVSCDQQWMYGVHHL